tara:strand:+ start:122 stop:268 length:147 start_codon:yes stop_codon:yes gene_type:complete
MDNIVLTLYYVDVEELDYLRIKLLLMLIDESHIDRRVGINVDAISILE